MTKTLQSILLSGALLSTSFQLTAQTGPSGVGNSTNCQIWLDANTIVAPDGAEIANWFDISGNNHTFSQASSDFLPIYENTAIGGLPSLRFDGDNDFLESSSISELEGSEVNYFVVYEVDNTDRNCLIVSKYASSPSHSWVSYINSGTPRLVNAHYSPSIFWLPIFYAPTTASFLSCDISPSGILTYDQGVFTGARAEPYTANSGHEFVNIGQITRDSVTAQDYSLEGEIAEVIVYNERLNSLERILIENYLGAKYQMVIPTDLYAYEATHRFGLIGIGNNGLNSQNIAQGSGVVELSSPSSLSSGDFLLIAHTGESLDDFNTTDLPASLSGHQRYERVWRVDETNDVGTTTITFDLGDNDFAFPTSYRLLVDSDGIFSDATEITGVYDSGSNSVSFTHDFSSDDFFTLAGLEQVLEIHSITSGNWNTTSTWDCGCLPSQNDLTFIDPGTSVTVDANGKTNDLTVSVGGTLIMNSDVTLDIDRDWTINGTLSLTEGTISLTGNEAQTVNISTENTAELHNIFINNTSLDPVTFTGEGFFNLNGLLTPNLGTVAIDPSSVFTVISNSLTTTGRIGQIGPPVLINGDFTVQRFIPAGNADWRNITSPITGATFASWDPDLAMSGPGFPDGCAFDSEGDCFSSVRTTQNNSNITVLDVNEEIENLKGYEIFMGDDLETFSGTTLKTTGSINPPSDLIHTLNTGWSIIGNPYAAPIEYNSIDKTSQISDYYYVYDATTGAYQWYDEVSETSSIPEITANGLISIGQGVWVFVSSLGTLTYNQSNKSLDDATYIRTPLAEEALLVSLKEDNSTYIATISLEENELASDDLTDRRDIMNLVTGHEKAPNFAIYSDTVQVRKNFIKNDGRAKSFNLVSEVKNNGFHTISANNVANFDNYNKIWLYDNQTDEMINLKTESYTYFATTEDDTHRFKLILNNTGETAVNSGSSVATNEITIHDNIQLTQMGNVIEIEATIENEKIDEQPTLVTVTNVLGQKEVFSEQLLLVNGSNILTLPSELKGFYIITLRTGDQTISQKIML